jgi:hypothetical protein
MNPEKNSSSALIRPHPLAATVEALRSNRMELIAYVDEMCARTAQVDPRLEALLPEANRCERLRAEATELHALQIRPNGRRFTAFYWPLKISFIYTGLLRGPDQPSHRTYLPVAKQSPCSSCAKLAPLFSENR